MVIRTITDKFRRDPSVSAPPVIEVPEAAADIARTFAQKHGIPEQLLRALVQVESAGDPWAMRFEPGYRWLWDVRAGKPYRGDAQSLPAPSFVSQETELTGQRTSWGLLQVMGAVAREHGYRGRYLSVLCDPEFGMEYGCLHLKHLHSRFSAQGWEGVTAAYNAGSPRRRDDGRWVNQPYVDRVRHLGGLP